MIGSKMEPGGMVLTENVWNLYEKHDTAVLGTQKSNCINGDV
jgi:hypothetical protein